MEKTLRIGIDLHENSGIWLIQNNIGTKFTGCKEFTIKTILEDIYCELRIEFINNSRTWKRFS